MTLRRSPYRQKINNFDDSNDSKLGRIFKLVNLQSLRRACETFLVGNRKLILDGECLCVFSSVAASGYCFGDINTSFQFVQLVRQRQLQPRNRAKHCTHSATRQHIQKPSKEHKNSNMGKFHVMCDESGHTEFPFSCLSHATLLTLA